MARIKSVKFYNFTSLPNVRDLGASFFARFYDINNNLILIDFTNPISISSTYSENSEYIITASRSYNGSNTYGPQAAYHFENLNKNIDGNTKFGNWISHVNDNNIYSEWNKIEFKFPQYISDIRILHSMHTIRGINTCDIDIEFEDGITKTYNYVSNGQFLPYVNTQMINLQWDQDFLDSWFDSIEFSKSKQIYDSEMGLIETLDTNNFKNIPVNSIEKLKVIYTKPVNTLISCLVSFDQKQTWKTFNGNNWIEVSDTSVSNVILNCMDIEVLNSLDKNKLISGGFVGDLDFKIAMKTNDENKTPSVSKIYIEYK